MNEEDGIISRIMDKIIIVPPEIAVAVLAGVATGVEMVLVFRPVIFGNREGDICAETEVQIARTGWSAESVNRHGRSGVGSVRYIAYGN